MENSSDTIGNRTRDLPACSALPQTTVPPRASIESYTWKKVVQYYYRYLSLFAIAQRYSTGHVNIVI